MRYFTIVFIGIATVACDAPPTNQASNPPSDTEVATRAVYLDPQCLESCLVDCGKACGRGSPGKPGCLKDCQKDNQECKESCTRPGDPPVCTPACPSGAVCVNGKACVCPAGTTRCGDTCADLDHDEMNCGKCGAVCPGGTVCLYLPLVGYKCSYL
jgi:hypothetical protein